ncbi:MAG: protein kinase [Pseudomonadota bacterium]
MNAETEKMRDALAEQLSSFENRLDSKIDDVRLLADIQESMGQLLGTDGASEAVVRRVLQEQYDSGQLRKETFQLVKSMLDRFVSEQVPTTPDRHAQTRSSAPQVAVEHVQTIAEAAAELDDKPDTPVLEATAPPPADQGLQRTMVINDESTMPPSTADDRVQVGSVLRDRFLLQERVAGGSMGVVYKALDRRLAEAGGSDPYVAIKVLSPHLAENGQALRALQQEAAKGRALTHPNIVRFVDLDREDDLYFIVMEWLEGRTLADILDDPKTRKVDKDRAFEIVHQVGEALEYAHQRGIVHADVKPGNVMIMSDGTAKLFDFGVARVRQKQIEETQEFDPGVLGLLTPAYSSMQVLTGEDPTPSDDVFSLACLQYRLIAGFRVFGPRNAAEAAEEGMKPQCPQGMSEARWRVLKKALAYSRVTRFESMQDFLDAMDLRDSDPITITVPIREDMSIDDGPGAGRWIASLIVLLGLVGGALYQFDMIEPLLEKVKSYLPDDTGADFGASTVRESKPPVPEFDAAPLSTAAPAIATEVADPVDTVDDELPSAAAEVAVVGDTRDAEVFEDADESARASTPALVDFSALPAADLEIPISRVGGSAGTVSLRLSESGGSAIVDVVRDLTVSALTLRIEEVSFSGNRSPWATNQYSISNNGLLEFPEGQERARVTIAMTADTLREADQVSTLRIRVADTPTSELANIEVTLEDDDQRAFESGLPANTVAFAVSQLSVSEQDPAVQIDVLRFNPGGTRLSVEYAIRDITASSGEDYFAPGGSRIEFGPGQRTARLLIPLVQDFAFEDNEAFSVELLVATPSDNPEIYQRTAVIIRDDDS